MSAMAKLAYVLLALLPPSVLSPPETGFLQRTAEVGSTSYRYQVFVPSNWSADKKWPVILFLHGLGEVDTAAQT